MARYDAGEDTPALSRGYGISRSGLRKLLLGQNVSSSKATDDSQGCQAGGTAL
jgi:hypothetical protein